jgi:hypothetical protein
VLEEPWRGAHLWRVGMQMRTLHRRLGKGRPCATLSRAGKRVTRQLTRAARRQLEAESAPWLKGISLWKRTGAERPSASARSSTTGEGCCNRASCNGASLQAAKRGRNSAPVRPLQAGPHCGWRRRALADYVCALRRCRVCASLCDGLDCVCKAHTFKNTPERQTMSCQARKPATGSPPLVRVVSQ